MKYIVMESKRSYAILLDEDGRFVTAANLRYEVGQIVENPVLMVDSSGHRMRRRGLAAALAALLVVLILLLAGILWYQNFSTPYASVYFSVNPEVEAEINESGRVIDLEGRNSDGEDLIEDYHFWGKEKEEVISDLVSRARDMGYITGGDMVLLRIDTPDDASFAEYESDLRGATAAFASGSSPVTFEIARFSDSSVSQNPSDPDTGAGTAPREDSDDDDDDDDGDDDDDDIDHDSEDESDGH